MSSSRKDKESDARAFRKGVGSGTADLGGGEWNRLGDAKEGLESATPLFLGVKEEDRVGSEKEAGWAVSPAVGVSGDGDADGKGNVVEVSVKDN